MIVPPPPLTVDGTISTQHAVLIAFIARGCYGACVMCHTMCYDWLDMAEIEGLEPIVDDHGYLTDQLSLHPKCVPALLEHWAMLLSGDPDGIADGEVHGTVSNGPGTVRPDSAVRDSANSPTPALVAARSAARTGAYARRGAT